MRKGNFVVSLKTMLPFMILKKLAIFNYKNLVQAELVFSPKINCFLGENGVGKTNLLDAVYYLSFCKSATNPIDTQVITHGADFFMLQGYYKDANEEEVEVYSAVKKRHKKQFKLNKVAYKRMSDHIGIIPVVMISPQDGTLISGGSDERRAFLDSVISQFDKLYLQSLIRYNKALVQRNALLKLDAEPDEGVISIYEEMMATESGLIYERRKHFVEQFIPTFRMYYERISMGFEMPDLKYISQCQLGDMLEKLREGRLRDRIIGYSLNGIHKDELEMKLGEYPIKREGSQGQTKTFLIALKLAQYAFLRDSGKEKPLLLLDDIFDKLDARRVSRIIEIVSEDNFGQIFITDTNRVHLDRIVKELHSDYKLFSIKDGAVNYETIGL